MGSGKLMGIKGQISEAPSSPIAPLPSPQPGALLWERSGVKVLSVDPKKGGELMGSTKKWWRKKAKKHWRKKRRRMHRHRKKER